MNLAVVGHVEWGDFLVVPHLPAAGEILHVTTADEDAGGGGAMTAKAMASLNGGCAFFTAVGEDERGALAVRRLKAAPISVRAAVRPVPQRRVITFLTEDHERTITVLGDRLVPRGDDPLPWAQLRDADAVFFTGGDAAALRAARAARVLVATPRAGAVLRDAGVRLDALIGSRSDPGELIDDDLAAVADVVVRTEGGRGGSWRAAAGAEGRWESAAPPREICDAYGCGDAFAAGFTAGLAAHGTVAAACAVGARCGAALLGARAPRVPDLSRAG